MQEEKEGVQEQNPQEQTKTYKKQLEHMWTNGDPCLFLMVSDFNNEWDHQKLEWSAMEILVRDSVGAMRPIASS